MNHQLIRVACCLLITVAGTLAARADDATVTSATTNTAPTITTTTNASTNAVDTGAASTNDASAIPTATNTAPTTTATTNASTNAVETGTASTNDASAISTATNTSPAITTTTNESTNVVETEATSTNGTTTISATTNTTPTVTTTPNEPTNAVETETASSIPTAPPSAVAYQPFSLAAEAGTTGLGGTAGWRFANHFGLDGGMDYFSYSLNKTFNGNNYSGHLRLMSENFALNLYPWQNRSFHISLGGYVDQNRLTGNANGAVTVNGTPYVLPAGETLKLKYQPQSINPYVSVGGNLYFDKARHFSVGGELGAFYLGTPRVSLTDSGATVAASDLAAEQQTVQHDIKKLPVWPILKISVCYSF